MKMELTKFTDIAKDALKKVIEERQLDPQPLFHYLFDNVIVFVVFF